MNNMNNVYVLAFLLLNNKVLMLRRKNTGFADGNYCLVGGKVEDNERALAAIKREVYEEVNLDLDESRFELVHTLHRKGTEANIIVLCFKANISENEMPINKEPKKHDDMRFFDINELPENTIPAHKQTINCIENNILYSEHGWFEKNE